MIDTVWLTLPIRMHLPREMAKLGFISTCKHRGLDCSHRAKWRMRTANRIQLIWSEVPDRSHLLSVSGSLPRFVHGSNVRLFGNDEDLQSCLRVLSEYVSDVAEVRFDAFAAYVSRVDYCHDWQLTNELVTEYLWAFRGISLGRMKRHLIDNSTVELRNDSQTIAFYDKFEERSAMRLKRLCSKEEVSDAKGVLRMEVRFKDNRACQRHAARMEVHKRTAQALLREDVAIRTITGTLEHLGLNQPLCAAELKYERLRDYCGEDGAKCVRLAGFLKLAEIYGLENLVRLRFCSYSDFRRKLNEVKAAGVLYTVRPKRRTLPPLYLCAAANPKGIQAA